MTETSSNCFDPSKCSEKKNFRFLQGSNCKLDRDCSSKPNNKIKCIRYKCVSVAQSCDTSDKCPIDTMCLDGNCVYVDMVIIQIHTFCVKSLPLHYIQDLPSQVIRQLKYIFVTNFCSKRIFRQTVSNTITVWKGFSDKIVSNTYFESTDKYLMHERKVLSKEEFSLLCTASEIWKCQFVFL